MGMPTDLHTPKERERVCYVEWLAVMPNARGKGVGTKLLMWAEGIARERNSKAIKLYVRDGFVVIEDGCCERSLGFCMVTCLFGRPYGCCAPDWGGRNMRKELTENQQIMDR